MQLDYSIWQCKIVLLEECDVTQLLGFPMCVAGLLTHLSIFIMLL